MASLAQMVRQSARILGMLLLACPMYAQMGPARLRGTGQPPAAVPAAPAATPAISAQPQPASPGVSAAASMLQQPAQPAQVVLSGNSLSIHADNSSLSAILQLVASKSGMTIDGLGTDERVFGTFGPGVPRDVLADLLNGTAYNVVLLGDLSDGAPRELILTPATHGAVVPTPAPAAPVEEAEPEPEPPAPPPQEVPAQGAPLPATPAVKTPQQLFEQLQRLRQAQQQGAQQPTDSQQQPQQAPQ